MSCLSPCQLIVAEFSSFELALEAGRLCSESGVLLCCSVRGSFRGMVETFARQDSRDQRDVACLSFPFATTLTLSRNGKAQGVKDVPAAVCRADPRRLPPCGKHHAAPHPGYSHPGPCMGPMPGSGWMMGPRPSFWPMPYAGPPIAQAPPAAESSSASNGR